MAEDCRDMDEQQFSFLRQLLTARTGIRFRDRAHLSTKLGRRLRALDLADFGQYIALIRQSPGEIAYAIEAVTTNETFFFRDPEHLQSLTAYLDGHRDRARTFKIWSAACSSGEEAYSIAMTVHAWAAARGMKPGSVRISGSDIDRSALRHAVNGTYHRCQVERTPQHYKALLLRHLERSGGDCFCVRPHIRSMVVFKHFNLTHCLPFNNALDVIFCRNVCMYFGRDLRDEILAGMHRALTPGGLLILGLCEPMPLDMPPGFACMGHSVYMKSH